jgi:ABC-type glycerol-3-phosphate transport system substrate-binding protein
MGAGGSAKSMPPVTLEFLHRWEGSRTEVIDKVVATYQQQMPNVRVNSQLVFGNGDGFFDGMPYDKILAQISAGTPPDVSDVHHGGQVRDLGTSAASTRPAWPIRATTGRGTISWTRRGA